MRTTDFITKVMHLVSDLKAYGCNKTNVSIENIEVLKVSFENPILGFDEVYKVALEPTDNDWHYLSKSELIDKLKSFIKIYKKQNF